MEIFVLFAMGFQRHSCLQAPGYKIEALPVATVPPAYTETVTCGQTSAFVVMVPNFTLLVVNL